ncbi:HesA/MoeB/ThiF family protein [Flavobacterium agrisoli]|nr:HesA/MoeB/ThiF family protein [Flavobacterium agrisoli]
MSSRYNRQVILPQIGTTGQEKLQNAKVLLIGAGGLGATILPYLTAAGIGKIGIVDVDKIEITNLQRQVIYTTDGIGKSKVQEAKKSMNALNSDCEIIAYEMLFSAENALELVEKYDVIIDGTDNIATKYLINDACVVKNKPLVYGSVYRFEGQVAVFNYQNGPTYRCLYPNENRNSMNCVEAGVLGVSVGIIGMLQANEVLKILLGIGEVITGSVLIYNCLSNLQEKFSFAKKEVYIQSEAEFRNHFKTTEDNSRTIEITTIMSKISSKNVLFLDVRNSDELPLVEFENCIQIPLSELEEKHSILDKSKEIIVFCQSGIRSKMAAEMLQKRNFKNIINCEFGAQALVTLLKENKVSSH